MSERNFFIEIKISVLIRACAVCLLIFAVCGNLSAQYKGLAVKKEKLLSVLRSKQLQTREIVAIVRSNGVDFELTPAVQSELTTAGARPELIEAIRGNYRAVVAVKPGNKPANAVKSKFTGNPLTKDAVITLLENGVADVQVRKNVQSRGVNFKTNPQIIGEIKKAGGTIALVNLITSSYVDSNANNTGTSNNTVAATPSVSDVYDGLIDKAVDFYDNKKDKQGALNALQQAVKLDSTNARAYQLLGFMNLYGFSNFAEAERNMRESLARGGSAVFRVFHDHNGLFSDTCQGSLYVAKDSVRFESDNNVHTFQTSDADILKIKTNSAFKRAFQSKNGSFQIVLKNSSDKDGIKYSFAPLTDNIAESKMIISLIGK